MIILKSINANTRIKLIAETMIATVKKLEKWMVFYQPRNAWVAVHFLDLRTTLKNSVHQNAVWLIVKTILTNTPFKKYNCCNYHLRLRFISSNSSSVFSTRAPSSSVLALVSFIRFSVFSVRSVAISAATLADSASCAV